MSSITRVVLLVTALASLSAAASSTVGAVTWHNSGSTAFTATGGSATLSTGTTITSGSTTLPLNVACGGSQVTGTAPGGSTVFSTYNISGTATLTPCSMVGQSTFVQCTYSLLASAFSGGVASGIASLTCDVRLTAAPATSLCHLAGIVPASYTNPTMLPASPGRITLTASSTIAVTNGSVSCPIGVHTGSLNEQRLQVTNGTPTTLGPILNRTP